MEYQPVGELFDLRGWRLVFDNKDGSAPKWWTKEHKKELDDYLEHEHHKYHALDSTYIFPGDLDLYHLRNLNREGCTIIAGGGIRMSGLCTLPPRTTIIAKGGPVLLENLREVHRDCTVVSSEDVRLRYSHPNLNVVDMRSRERNARAYRRDDYYDSRYLAGYQSNVDWASVMVQNPPTIKP